MKLGLLLFLLPLSFCLPAAQSYVLQGARSHNPTLEIWGAANINAIRPVLQQFVRIHPDVTLRYSEFSTMSLYKRLQTAASGQEPDVVMSPAMDLQFKLVNDGYAQPYRSNVTSHVPLNNRWRFDVFAYAYEPIVMVINKDILGHHSLPTSREQLLSLMRQQSPLVDGKIGLNDIEKVGLGYLTWFHDSQLSRTYGRLLESFGQHHARLYNNTSDILEGLVRGDVFIAYNLVGSYAFAWSRKYPWIETVMPTDYTTMVLRTLFIHKNASNQENARVFVDYLLSNAGQSVMASQSDLIPITQGLLGKNSIESIKRLPHGIFRPIPFGLPLLVQSDQAKKSLLLSEWRSAIHKMPEQ